MMLPTYSERQTIISSALPSVIYIWEDRLLYIGKTPDSSSDVKFTLDALMLNLEQPYKVTIDKGKSWERFQSLLWPTNVSHQTAFEDSVVVAFLTEHNSFDSHFLKTNMTKHRGNFYVGLKNELSAIEIFKEIYLYRPDIKETDKLLNYVIRAEENIFMKKEKNLDNRIRYVMNLIKSDPSSNVSIREISNRINLSESRLQHLFKEVTRTHITRYRTWFKIIETLKGLSLNNSVTHSALDAGFTDISHFTRSFKMITGTSPTSIFRQNGKPDFFIDEFR